MRPDEKVVVSHHFDALGTTCSLFACGEPVRRLVEGESWVRRLGARLTRFSPDSELSMLNAAAGRRFEISSELESLLREALRAHELSAGLVNVAVLPSMVAIGYSAPLLEGAGVVTLDGAAPLRPLPEVLTVRSGSARVEIGAALDLGGVAKGWMADRLCEQLGPNSVANIGGDLMAVGRGPDGRGWPMAIAGVTVLLSDQGAATSSVLRRRWGDMHHLIDPRTGRPARTGLAEVSVVGGTGIASEVMAKTALLMGPQLAPVYCAGHAFAWWLSRTDDR
ncbi:MAG TPA: FAD:protein FMN transferase [Candidatus Sulfotelmatobacter sp.]|nr:FAD:protein FMN transferase [Candidatus Sulfotelmatobacter sp.]